MAHNITSTDSLFTVREPAWHGLGRVLSDYPTIEEARTIAHPWEPVDETVYRKTLHVDGETQTHTYEAVPDYKLLTRSDNAAELGIVGGGYQAVKNVELYEIAEALEKESREGRRLQLETGGSLKGGRKVWLLLRLDEPLTVPGDPRGEVIPYFALQNSHDGTAALRGQATLTRIVCDNTAQLADFDSKARGTSFTFRHTSSITQRLEMAKLSLTAWREGITTWQHIAGHLMGETVTPDEVDQFIERFFPEPVTARITDRTRANVEEARAQYRSILTGPTCEAIEGTAYGLVQAAVEWNQHHRPTRGTSALDRMENRFQRGYLDRSDLTRAAMQIVGTL